MVHFAQQVSRRQSLLLLAALAIQQAKLSRRRGATSHFEDESVLEKL